MQLLKLSTGKTNPNEFVGFWKEFYDGFDNAKYREVINKDVLTTTDIRNLFLWKNNMKNGLALTKQTFVEAITREIDTVNELKRNFSWSLFEQKFSKRGPVWMITLLHVINQEEFPIYDQHAFRAYIFIETGRIVPKEEIPKSYQVYKIYKAYQSFFNRFKNEAFDYTPKQVDEALWTFGKFLSLYPKMIYGSSKR